jgi:hypothetical protein
MTITAPLAPLETKDPVVREAQKRFKRTQTWESSTRNKFLDDIRFANADADNHWQWPENIRKPRDKDDKPCLTINKTRQHNLLIINDAKQNKPGIKVRPVGNQATFEASQVWMALLRRIEYQSNASTIYDRATTTQVQGGVGYWRVITKYCDEESFDQDAFIDGIMDPLKVYIDPEAKEADKSDMRFAFIFDEADKDEFEDRYPEYAGQATGQSALGADDDWCGSEKIRWCEYYRVVEKEDTLFLVPEDGGSPQRTKYRASDLAPELAKEFRARKDVKKRQTTKRSVEWYFICGNRKLDKKDFPSKYIPIVQVKGEETVIDGELDRKGHTRALKDPQRMYNYWSSTAVEYGALQTKTPWIVPVEAVEGFQEIWRGMNRTNYAYIPYRSVGEDGAQIPPPQRVEPPTAAPVALQGMEIAARELMMASGQYEAQQGQGDNSRTGQAIQERQRQGDKATYHFIDELAISIRYTGKILLDVIPKIYDTERVVMIMAEDGTTSELKIDPGLQQAYQQELSDRNEAINRVLNPSYGGDGQYEVESDVGPAYASRREEAFNAYTLILTQAPDLAAIIGDLLFKAADFPMADEAAARLRRMVPPQALGTGPSPQEQELQQQLAQAQEAIKQLTDLLAEKHLQLKGKAEGKTIDAYNAITKRLKALAEGHMDVNQMHLAISQLLYDMNMEAHDRSLDTVRATTERDLASAQIRQGASSNGE